MFYENDGGLMLHIHEIICNNNAPDKPSGCLINLPEVCFLNKTNVMVHRRLLDNFKTLFALGLSKKSDLWNFSHTTAVEVDLCPYHFCLACMSLHLRLHITQSSAQPHVIPTEL